MPLRYAVFQTMTWPGGEFPDAAPVRFGPWRRGLDRALTDLGGFRDHQVAGCHIRHHIQPARLPRRWPWPRRLYPDGPATEAHLQELDGRRKR